MGASLYEPINVLKPMGPDIGIVDGPVEYLTVGGVRLPLPFTTRMTVVRLSNGDLFLHSPIKFDQALASELQRMGTIRHLVSPNQFHYAHIGEWSKAFPNAISWASPRVRQRARARHVDVTFARDLGFNPPEEWQQDIEQTLFPGGYFKESVGQLKGREHPSHLDGGQAEIFPNRRCQGADGHAIEVGDHRQRRGERDNAITGATGWSCHAAA